MTIEDILAGESKNVEFKETLPEKSIKYMKTVVAFANGTGGKIIFGVRDEDNTVVGIQSEAIFRTMDAITTAISDSCQPAIVPDVTLQTIGGKTVIIVEVSAGRQRPYYIKSQGMESGTYIRVSGTTRPAEREQIKEMFYESDGRSYDCVIRKDIQITEEDIDNLCQAMKNVAIRNCQSDVQRAMVKDVTKNVLLSWGVLAEEDGKIYPTNAYVFLLGLDSFLSRIQCGVFKGTTRAVFVDRREYTGPIWEQIEQAYQFVLRNIRLGAKLEGIYRKDKYELPPESIRELIVNAAVHCSFLQSSLIQVALFDDRLEITSPGGLLSGVTIERMKEGYSKVRNRAIASAFLYMNIIEQWGSGVPRIIREVSEYGLAEPEFIDMECALRINIFRNSSAESIIDTNQEVPDTNQEVPDTNQEVPDTNQEVPDTNQGIPDTNQIIPETKIGANQESAERLFAIIQQAPNKSQKEYAKMLNASLSTTKRLFVKLQEDGLICREGTSRKGKWIVIEK